MEAGYAGVHRERVTKLPGLRVGGCSAGNSLSLPKAAVMTDFSKVEN
jgi:hypothetical protein